MGIFLPRIVLSLMLIGMCRSHGRLVNPPSRASAWRYGFDLPVDYNDNGSNCGGFSRQWLRNKGKCGICGDPWEKKPRPHERGGKFATDTIVANYTQAEIISVEVDVTANHLGRMEFRICPLSRVDEAATQECLDRHPLYLANGGTTYDVGRKRGKHTIQLKLPKMMTCSRCVLQWRYVAGNNWGHCSDGTSGLGCGPQEEFRACADIAIRPLEWDNNHLPTGENDNTTMTEATETPNVTPTTIRNPQTTSTKTTTAKSTTTSSVRPTTQRRKRPRKTCRANRHWRILPHMDDWCQRNCNHVPSFCPKSHCECS